MALSIDIDVPLHAPSAPAIINRNGEGGDKMSVDAPITADDEDSTAYRGGADDNSRLGVAVASGAEDIKYRLVLLHDLISWPKPFAMKLLAFRPTGLA